VIHAGDLCTLAALDELRALGPPVVAVRGNADDAAVRAALPDAAVVEAGGARIAVVHDAGRTDGRLARLRRRFPDADAVVFGHSHVPLLAAGPDGVWIFNPGSPADRRCAPRHTMGTCRAAGGTLAFGHVDLD